MHHLLTYVWLKKTFIKRFLCPSVELALGSSPGRSDVRGFRVYGEVDGMYVMERLALSTGATVYVTARITNTVGLYVIATSDAVVISPEPRLEVSA